MVIEEYRLKDINPATDHGMPRPDMAKSQIIRTVGGTSYLKISLFCEVAAYKVLEL